MAIGCARAAARNSLPPPPASRRGTWFRQRLAAGLLVALALASCPSTRAAAPGQGYTPESPEVVAAVGRAIKFLQKDTTERRIGGRALMGLALVKGGTDLNDPLIKGAAEELAKAVETGNGLEDDNIPYTLGLSIIFLAELDPQKHGEQINGLLKRLLACQKPHGGWGYLGRPTGDTSMTQYGVLSMWEASRAGFATPIDAWERVCNWLLRTQDPTGGFGYQGVDPENFERTRQIGVRHSLSAAGSGCLYICQDHLGLASRQSQAGSLPSSLRRVEKRDAEQRGVVVRRTANVDAQRLKAAEQLGNAWFETNYEINPPGGYMHYYLYALERYQSFREALGGPPEKRPWYDDGVNILLESQAADGSWSGMCGPACDTAFSILFLVRSMRKSLTRAGLLGDGALLAGRGLPSDGELVQTRGGEVVAKPLAGPAEHLLTLMEDADNPEYLSAVEGFAELAGQADEETLNKHARRLRELADSPRPEARVAAVRALARTRNIDEVPTLIYALSDPDGEVVQAAVEGLRVLSRKPPKSPGTVVTDDASRRAAIEFWKSWYRALRPDTNWDD
ncbi:MAG: terpene cyclase/mutase family protein [Pirellulales bacterium]|nr:terpene cyclase/mutase family protein [Pirellulales bacterium]